MASSPIKPHVHHHFPLYRHSPRTRHRTRPPPRRLSLPHWHPYASAPSRLHVLTPADIDAMTLTFPTPTTFSSHAPSPKPVPLQPALQPRAQSRSFHRGTMDPRSRPALRPNPLRKPHRRSHRYEQLSDFHLIDGLMIPKKSPSTPAIGDPQSARHPSVNAPRHQLLHPDPPIHRPLRHQLARWRRTMPPQSRRPPRRPSIDIEIYTRADTIDTHPLDRLNRFNSNEKHYRLTLHPPATTPSLHNSTFFFFFFCFVCLAQSSSGPTPSPCHRPP